MDFGLDHLRVVSFAYTPSLRQLMWHKLQRVKNEAWTDLLQTQLQHIPVKPIHTIFSTATDAYAGPQSYVIDSLHRREEGRLLITSSMKGGLDVAGRRR